MAYESYNLFHSNTSSPKEKMLDDKNKQIRYLYNIAMDRENGCLLNGIPFTESPRIFDRKIKTNYYQTLTCETINENDRFNSGNLLFYDNDYWICTSSFVFHGLYCKGNFIRTNYTMKWQSNTGDIIECRAYVISASQYNSGEEQNKTIILATDQLFVIMPSNDETIELSNDKRMFISKSKNNPIPYRLTRNDTVPYSDWDNGCISLIFSRDELNTSTDRQDLLLCDYIVPTTPPTPIDDETTISCVISGKEELKLGYNRSYSVEFTDVDGNILDDVEYTWNVNCDFSNQIIMTETETGMKLCCNNEDYIAEEFDLEIIVDDVVIGSKTISIIDSY